MDLSDKTQLVEIRDEEMVEDLSTHKTYMINPNPNVELDLRDVVEDEKMDEDKEEEEEEEEEEMDQNKSESENDVENKESEPAVEPAIVIDEKEAETKPEKEDEEEAPAAAENTSDKDHDIESIPDDDNDEDNEDEPKLGFQVGRTVTLQMLMAAKLLEPGKAAMSIEYLGQKFVGDLLPDGKIKSQETETIFCSPSAWAMHCKRIINPEKKSGCGWASVRYKNKKLDAIKTTYLRKCQLQKDSNLSDEADADIESKPGLPEPEIKRIVLPFNTVNNRHIVHDPNTLVESVSFLSQNKLQPFMVSITTSSVLLMDFHCHLTKQEVCGYLGGSWDNNTQTLAITHAFPVRNTRHDRHYAIEIEQQIQRNMLKKNLILVGWYHSHPRIAAHPTLRDCDAQLEYQIKMCGISDETYTPCVGLICAPYYSENPNLESSISAFWVVPPAENRPMEYGRPMSMQFSVSQDIEMSDHIKTEMVLAIDYYRQFDNEMVNFEAKYDDDVTLIEKLKTTLYSKFPREQNDFEFWNWLRQNLGLQAETTFTPPKLWSTRKQQTEADEAERLAKEKKVDTASRRSTVDDVKVIQTIEIKDDGKEPEIVEIKDDDKPEMLTHAQLMAQLDMKDEKMQIRSLQEQLKLPSGLNMTPSPISSIPTMLQPAKSSSSSANAAAVPLVSPRDSPISTPSNSASPATKFDIRPPATPSPAKSDVSSTRNRNSPMPNNLSKYPAYHNTPTSTKSGSYSNDPTLAATKAMEELLAASFSGGKFPSGIPGYSSADYAALLQQASTKDLTAAANLLATAPTGDKHAASLSASALDPSTNMKDFLAQLEKSTELSYLLQQQYQYPGLAGMSHLTQAPNSAPTAQTNTPKTTKHGKRNSRSSSNSSQRNFEDDFKNDPSKLNDSSINQYQEYAKMLLNQAEALNAAVAHQNYGEISSIVSAINTLPTNTSVSAMPSRKSRKSSTTTQSQMSSQPSLAELSQLLHGPGASSTKMHELLRQMESSAPGLNISSKQSQKQQQQQQRQEQQRQQQEQQRQQQEQQEQQQQHLNMLMQQQLTQSSKGSSGSSSKSSKNQQSQNNAISDYMSLLSQAKIPDLATLMAQSYGSGADGSMPSAADLSMLLRPQYGQQGAGKNADLASLNASIDMLGNLFSSNKNAGDLNSLNSLLFSQGGKGAASAGDISSFLAAAGHQSMNPPATQSFSSKGSALNNPYYSQSAAALDKAQQDLIALYNANPIPSSIAGGSSKFATIPDPLSKTTLAANNMFMNPSSIYAKMQQDALNAMIMKPPSKASSKGDSKSRDTSESRLMASPSSTPSPSAKHNFSAVDLAVSSVNQSRPSSRSPHKKQFSISDLVSQPPSKMMKFAESFGHDPHDDKEILNLSGSSSEK